MKKKVIFVFAFLKPSQVLYKIIPLAHSVQVEKVIILRKTPFHIDENKIECISLPKILRFKLFYWLFTPFYGIYLILKKRADIILNYNILPHGFNAFFASVITRRPVIFAEINEDTIRYFNNRITKPFIKMVMKNARHITVPGSKTKSFWINKGFKEISHLHSTINTNFFKPDESVNKSVDFLFIGEFDNNKRPQIVIDAFAQVLKKYPKVNLTIIGYGTLQDSIKSQIKNYGLEKSITLFSTNNVLPYIQKAKILIMASLSEGIPCSMLEAMSCELIVLVPPVGDIADVIRDTKNGFLHNNSEEDILQRMIYSIEHYENLETLRKQARKTIEEEWSYQVASGRWDNLLQKIS